MVIMPGTGASTALPMIVSTEGFVGLIFFRAGFFAPARLGLSFVLRFFGVPRTGGYSLELHF
jgi:hypothetical protein